jgi:hypothetical protein
MPYDIIKVKGGYKVAKKDNHKKTFSSYPISKEMANKQRKAIYMNSGEFRKEHEHLTNLLNTTSNALKTEALTQSKEARMRLGKGVKTRGSRVVMRGGNVMGCGLFDVLSGKQTLDFGKLMDKGSADLRRLQTGKGLFGDLFEDAVVEGGKKLYNFDKEHGSHLKEGVKSGFKNMVSNFFKGGRGVDYRTALSYGRGQNRFAVLPDVMPEYDPNDVSGWVEKERRSTGYYGRPAILGEGM